MKKIFCFLLFLGVFEVAFGRAITSDLSIKKFFKEIGTLRFTNAHGQNQVKKYYATRSFKLSWANAFSFCKANDMDLVELYTESEANQFMTMCFNHNLDNYVHIGGSAEGNSNRLDYYWMTTGEPIAYKLKYSPDQPDNKGGNERCLSVLKRANMYAFNDVNCYEPSIWNFVCQQVEVVNIEY